MQTTLKSPAVFDGIGLHSGAPARMVVRPAKPGHGIWFHRADIEIGDARIPALWHRVDRTPLCTRLENHHGVTVSTVEHIMAALAGCGIHNAEIEIDGPEVPILDGSAAPFMRGLMRRGVRKQNAALWAIEILKPVHVQLDDTESEDAAKASLLPSDQLEISFSIDFSDAAIGRQNKTLDMRNGAFARELCDSRTFCRQADVDLMHENGLALGGTLENAVVVDGKDVLSPGGFRHDDEAVRHKMLDALGDLALAGAPILGRYEGVRAGHALTNTLLRALFETPGAFRMVQCDAEMAERLPGQGLVWAEIPQVA